MEFRRNAHTTASETAHTPSAPLQPPTTHKSKRPRKVGVPQGKMLLWAVVIVLLAAAASTAAYYINRYQDSQKQVANLSDQLKNPDKTAKAEQEQLINRVSQITVLPKGETPTIATVTDVSKLKEQAFFASAQNGDRVLIYTKAKKAYLYRPSTNKIINIAPVNIGDDQKNTNTTDQTP